MCQYQRAGNLVGRAASADMIYVDPLFDTGRSPYYWPPADGERAESMHPTMRASPPCDWI
jgi:hypothetical protein